MALKKSLVIFPLYFLLITIFYGLFVMMSALSRTRVYTEPFAHNERHVIDSVDIDFPKNCFVVHKSLFPINNFQSVVTAEKIRICLKEQRLLKSLFTYKYPLGEVDVTFEKLEIEKNAVSEAFHYLFSDSKSIVLNGSFVLEVLPEKTVKVMKLNFLEHSDGHRSIPLDKYTDIASGLNAYLPKTIFE